MSEIAGVGPRMAQMLAEAQEAIGQAEPGHLDKGHLDKIMLSAGTLIHLEGQPLYLAQDSLAIGHAATLPQRRK